MNQNNNDTFQRYYGQFDQNHDQLRNELVGRVATSKSDPSAEKTLHIRRWIMRTTVGLAASIFLGALLWVNLVPSISLAEVVAAIEKQPWIHVTFDNGEEIWASLPERKHAVKRPADPSVFIDYATGVRHFYWPNFGYISEDNVYSASDAAAKSRIEWLPKTPLEFAGIYSEDIPEGSATEGRKRQDEYMERHSDTIDGRDLVRFDFYHKDALEKQILMKQVWVDPDNRLPVRIRSWLQLGARQNPDKRYTVGHYDYPASGPTDIYALGVPRDVSVVRDDGPLSPNVGIVVEAATKAKYAFPERFRVITWPADEASEVDVLWWDGKPVPRPGLQADFRGVRIRAEHFFNLDLEDNKENEPYHLPLPASADEVLAWTRTQVPVEIDICDGGLTYRKVGPYPAPFLDQPQISVHVISVDRGMYFPQSKWPTDYLWPIAERSGRLKLLTEASDAQPDTIVLQSETGDRRTEYHIDLTRDHICTKEIWWEKNSGQWRRSRDYALLDLDQLEGGQWYARKRVLMTYGDPAKKISGSGTTWNVDIAILGPGEFPAGAFDGKGMMDQAKANGGQIESQ